MATSSAHAQHMYGHVLPHFKRWNEADKQFTIADDLHNAWAKKNKVSPSEDWHYYHNLHLWSVTKMVVEPHKVSEILIEIQALNTQDLVDYLDYSSATLITEDQKNKLERLLNLAEAQSPELKKLVLSSRLYFNIAFNPTESTFQEVIAALKSKTYFKNKRLLSTFITLLQTQNTDLKLYTKAQNRIVDELKTNFERGGFDGWKKSVMDALKYKRLFQLYGLSDSLTLIEKDIFDVYMTAMD